MLSSIALVAAGSSSSGSSGLVSLLPLLLLLGVFYFILIRPRQRQMRAQKELLSAVEVDDEVVTIGGIFGIVTGVDDDEGSVDIEVAPGVELRFLKSAIARRMVYDEDEPDEGDEGDGEPEEDREPEEEGAGDKP